MGQGKVKKQKITCEEGELLSDEDTTYPSSNYRNEPRVLKSNGTCSLDDLNSGVESPSLTSSDVAKPNEEKPCAAQSACFKLFIDYGSRLKKIRGKPINVPRPEFVEVVDQKLSTNSIIRLAGEKFIEFLESSGEDLSIPRYLEEVSSLRKEDARDVALVFYLLASAEKVGQKQFDHARRLLEHCEELSSCLGDPVQRLVYYFHKALGEKIDREFMAKAPLNSGMEQLMDVEEEMMSVNSTFIALTKVNPLGLFIQLAAIQAMVDNVTEAKKVHIIDFAIKGGQQHSMLIKALALESECRLEHLKITAVGTTGKSKIEETGNSLISFAQSLSLPFSFNVVMVDDILNLEEGLLSVNSDETVVVYSAYFLRRMLGQPDRLESLMRVIRNIKPCLMVVAEVESNHNSPVFVNRFIEALFFYGAQFDSLEDCMKNDESHRTIMESFYFGKGIHNIMATEGEQRAFREVKISVWRSFFHRFGMLETPLSKSSLSQAKLVLKNYPCCSSCTLHMDGECQIIGWKETPLYSLSAWRFKR